MPELPVIVALVLLAQFLVIFFVYLTIKYAVLSALRTHYDETFEERTPEVRWIPAPQPTPTQSTRTYDVPVPRQYQQPVSDGFVVDDTVER